MLRFVLFFFFQTTIILKQTHLAFNRTIFTNIKYRMWLQINGLHQERYKHLGCVGDYVTKVTVHCDYLSQIELKRAPSPSSVWVVFYCGGTLHTA